MSMNAFPGQSAVVMPPRGEREEPKKGVPRTIPTIVQAHFYAAQVADEEGTLQQLLLVEIGGKFFSDPNGGAWIGQLQEVKPWVQDQMRARVLKIAPEAPPKEKVSPLRGPKAPK